MQEESDLVGEDWGLGGDWARGSGEQGAGTRAAGGVVGVRVGGLLDFLPLLVEGLGGDGSGAGEGWGEEGEAEVLE